MTVTPDMPPDDNKKPRPKHVDGRQRKHAAPLTPEEATALNAIIGENWQQEPEPYDLMDPGMKIMIDEVTAAEDAMTYFSASGDTNSASKVLYELDRMYGERGIKGRIVSITGKVRVKRDNEGDAIFSYAGGEEEVVHYISQKLGEPKYDIAGEYFDVSGLNAVAGAFDIDQVAYQSVEGASDGSCILVSFGFVPMGYPDIDEPLMYMYREDIKYIGLPSRTIEGNLEVLEQFNPDVSKVLNQLPDSCLDTKALVRGIRNFSLKVDWNTVREFDSKSDFIAAVEMYIMRRLNVDNADYRFLIRGSIGTLTADFTVTSVKKRLPRVYRMRMTDAKLIPVDKDGDTTTYRLGVEAYMPVPEDGGGAIPIIISPDALLAMQRTRPRRLPFKFDTMINHRIGSDDWTSYVRPIDGEAFIDPEQTEAERAQIAEDDARDTRVQQMITTTKEILAKSLFEYSKAMVEQIKEFLALAQELTAIQYDTTEDRDAAREALESMFRAIQEKYSERPFAMAVRGDGLFFSGAVPTIKFCDETARLSIVHEKTGGEMGDVTTMRIGPLEDAHFFEHGSSPGKYSLMVILRFEDMQRTHQLTQLSSNEGDLPYLEVSQRQYFFAQLFHSVDITAVNLDALCEQEEIIRSLLEKASVGEASMEVRVPIELYNEVRQAPVSGFVTSVHTDAVRQLAIECELGNCNTERVCRNILGAIGRGSSVMIGGTVYDSDGAEGQSAVTGKLVDVIPSMRRTPETGPIAVLQQSSADYQDNVSTRTWYVPLAKIAEIKF